MDSEPILRWLPPKGAKGELLAFEPEPGGAFRMTLTFAESDGATKRKTTANSDAVDGRFVELSPFGRIVQRFTFKSDDPAFAGTMTMTWSFLETNAGTQVKVEARDVPPGIKPEEHREGIASSLDQLARYVETKS